LVKSDNLLLDSKSNIWYNMRMYCRNIKTSIYLLVWYITSYNHNILES